jgi:3' terminal RNA ribose 2'-O-methyltransferase Hen1
MGPRADLEGRGRVGYQSGSPYREGTMLLTLSTTHTPATDLGFLLAKNPSRLQSFELPFGQAHVFYPEATVERCTAALLLDLDPIGLVRGWRGPGGEGGTLGQYVNDRPYVASSFFSVAMARVFASALKGVSRERAALAEARIPLEARLEVVPCRGGEPLLRRLFEPLGYEVEAKGHGLDDTFPEWGDSQYFSVGLSATCRLQDLLTQLYVLLPVLDNDKHYWVGDDELEKLLSRGEAWLSSHPEREQIVSRYLKRQRPLVREALARLVADEEPDLDAAESTTAQQEAAIEEKISLNDQRLGAVVAVLKEVGARRVIDLGCGEGKLLQALLRERSFERIVGVDVSHRALEIARKRLRLEDLPSMQRDRIELVHGALTYRDDRFSGFDAACLVEVIEHLDADRLPAFARVVFEFAQPPTVILTTPNAEYNVRFDDLPAGRFRHGDHRFEWTREEFRAWAETTADRNGYRVRFVPVGPDDAELGSPTQMGIFTR